ncbi:MAG: GFA family protein [Hyphomonadaceae bacterium]|nr:GFA family protein [Hyphomonadaceae bacterium]
MKGIEGGCHCGAVRYRLDRAPEASMVCHCRSCQRVTGAPIAAWVSAEKARFHLIRGEPKRYASSPDVERTFCGGCGTQLTYAQRGAPDEIDVATASLDEPGAFPPTHHSWLEDNIGWVRFGDGLPEFRKSRFGS